MVRFKNDFFFNFFLYYLYLKHEFKIVWIVNSVKKDAPPGQYVPAPMPVMPATTGSPVPPPKGRTGGQH